MLSFENPAKRDRDRRGAKAGQKSTQASTARREEERDLLAANVDVLSKLGLTFPLLDDALLTPLREEDKEEQRKKKLQQYRKKGKIELNQSEAVLRSLSSDLRSKVAELEALKVEVEESLFSIRYKQEERRTRTLTVKTKQYAKVVKNVKKKIQAERGETKEESDSSSSSGEGDSDEEESEGEDGDEEKWEENEGWEQCVVPGFSDMHSRIGKLSSSISAISSRLEMVRVFSSCLLYDLMVTSAPSVRDYDTAEELRWIEEETARLEKILPRFDHIARVQQRMKEKARERENRKIGFTRLKKGQTVAAAETSTAAITARIAENRTFLLNLAVETEAGIGEVLYRNEFGQARRLAQEAYLIRQKLRVEEEENESAYKDMCESIAAAEYAWTAKGKRRERIEQMREEVKRREREFIRLSVKSAVSEMKEMEQERQRERDRAVMERRRSDAERKKQLEVKKKHMLDHHIAADKLPLKKREEGLSGLLSKLSKQGVRIPADVLSFASTVTARSSREGVGRKKDSDEVGGKTRDGRRRPESALAGEAKQGGKGQKRQIGGDAAATLSRRSSVSSAKRY